MGMSSVLLQDSPCASALNSKIIIFHMLFNLGFPPTIGLSPGDPPPESASPSGPPEESQFASDLGKELSQDAFTQTN